MLEVIDEECDRMDRFVEGLIDLARIEAGELHLRRRWGVIDEIVATVPKRAEPLTRKHQVEVVIADEIPAVRVDPRAVAGGHVYSDRQCRKVFGKGHKNSSHCASVEQRYDSNCDRKSESLFHEKSVNAFSIVLSRHA